ncbi:hypothetical protein BDV96DRAFT_505808 [Lophiotrema nucula]|uniref:Zn(2)-C6 fungal-type domain-containing protein n=1 Tax=Lophiotrema nucula TaxID=690887 RepID=A0A6A5YL43_9PLEO|nr:hypothetical protein BDV96DRAFT_505808 [Lophiotrema nucula]
MAYPRKPSASCEECRKRRTKCNKARPSCGQCIRTKRICPGYRESEDFVFFDESDKVAKKSSAASRSASPPERTSPPKGRPVAVAQYATPVNSPEAGLPQDLDILALNFFVSNYVHSDSMSSQFDFLPGLYAREGLTSSGLQQSMKAVGLAGLGKSINRPDFITSSRKCYLSAIQTITNALSQPQAADRDSTLSSILLMGMYEVLLLPDTSGLTNLKRHLDGAITLANMRLQAENRTDVEMKMIGSLVQSVIMSSWIQNIPLPAGFHALRRQHNEEEQPSTVHAIFLDHLVDMIGFRHAMCDNTYTTPNAAIYEAVRIDKRLASFLGRMPQEGRYQEVHGSGEPAQLVYDEYYHVYPSNLAAHLWNSVRSSRLRLHRIIIMKCLVLLKATSKEDVSAFAEQRAISEAIVRSLSRDICASVPQLAGYVEDLESYSERASVRSRSESLEPTTHFLYDRGQLIQAPAFLLSPIQVKRSPSKVSSSPRRANLYNILYMLYALRPVAILPEDMKLWIQQRVEWIEAKTEPDDLALLKGMLHNKPHHGPAWVAAERSPAVNGNGPTMTAVR